MSIKYLSQIWLDFQPIKTISKIFRGLPVALKLYFTFATAVSLTTPLTRSQNTQNRSDYGKKNSCSPN